MTGSEGRENSSGAPYKDLVWAATTASHHVLLHWAFEEEGASWVFLLLLIMQSESGKKTLRLGSGIFSHIISRTRS